MKKTLYITDLDGTLLNSDSKVSEKSRILLNNLIERHDIAFSIATARTPATVVQLMQGVDCRLPLIVMTGAAMWSNDGLVNRNYLQTSEIDILIDVFHHHDIRPFFYTYNGRMIEAYHLPALDDYERQFVDRRCNTPFKRFVFGSDMPEQRRASTMLVFAAADYERMGQAYAEARRRLDCEMTYYRDIFNPQVGFLEVMARGVSKARAVSLLRRQVGADRVVVFGDSPNDLSMRLVADVFIAPANAADEVRRVADEVTLSNNDDCVARWIDNDVSQLDAK